MKDRVCISYRFTMKKEEKPSGDENRMHLLTEVLIRRQKYMVLEVFLLINTAVSISFREREMILHL